MADQRAGAGRPGSPRYALLPGDPDRVGRLVRHLAHVQVATAGTLSGDAVGLVGETPVVVAATGMGGPGTAVTVQRLAAAGVDTFVRVGGAGPVVDDIGPGDLVVASAAVRHEGTSAAFLPRSWPAVATPVVTAALLRAARHDGLAVRCGVVHTKDSFFGEVEPASSPVEPVLREHWRALQRLGVLASEMEASVLFALALSRGWRAGAVVKINDVEGQQGRAWRDDEDLCRLAVAGVAELSRTDAEASGG